MMSQQKLRDFSNDKLKVRVPKPNNISNYSFHPNNINNVNFSFNYSRKSANTFPKNLVSNPQSLQILDISNNKFKFLPEEISVTFLNLKVL